jgi:DNA-binding transcriptional ArsR family regulator
MSITSIMLGVTPYTPPIGALRTISSMPASNAGATVSEERKAVFEAVEAGCRTVDDICFYLEVTQQSVAYHLKPLTELGLIAWVKVGKKHSYYPIGKFEPAEKPGLDRYKKIFGDNPFTPADLSEKTGITQQSAASMLCRWVSGGDAIRVGRVGRNVLYKFGE